MRPESLIPAQMGIFDSIQPKHALASLRMR
jgi:hypothetical protein